MTGTAIQKGEPPLKTMLLKATETIRAIAPSHVDADRIARVAYLACYRDPKLRTADAVSIVNAVVSAASLGLEIGGPSQEAYLLPFGSEATLVIGYRGLLKLARQSEQILGIEARVVYKGDHLEYEYGDNPHITHRPDPDAEDQKDADIRGAYAIAWLRDAPHPQFIYLSRAQIEKRRKVSKASGSGPWVSWYPEQCVKTVLRQLVKLLPSNRDLATAVELENRWEVGERTSILDIDTPEQIAEDVREKTSAKTAALKDKLHKASEAEEQGADTEDHMEKVRRENLRLDLEMQEAEKAARRDAGR